MFLNAFWFGENEVYYDEPQPEYNVDTAASQVIRYPAYASVPQVMVDRLGPPPAMKGAAVPQTRVGLNQAPQPMALVPGVVQAGGPGPHYRVVEFRAPLCCEGCHERVGKRLRRVRGVDAVHCNLHQHKVTVRGFAAPAEVLRALQKLWKRSDYWAAAPLAPPKGMVVGRGDPRAGAAMMVPVAPGAHAQAMR